MGIPTNLVTLSRDFGVNPIRMTSVQDGVYRIMVPKGHSYSLKRMRVPFKRLRWIDQSLQGLRNNGFNRLGWRNIHNKEGRRLFVSHKGSPYILAPWIFGRWPSPLSPSDMRACGIALAQFHQAARRSRRINSNAANRVGSWSASFQTKHRLMSRLIRRGNTSSLLQKHGAEILRYSNQTQQLLREHGYQKICRTHPHLILLCHGDGGPTNFIMNIKGMHVIDFETLRVDLRAYDLYRVIYNSCKDYNWKFSIARHFLDGYQRVSKLERSDYLMLRLLLRFPQTMYLLLQSYYRDKTINKKTFEKEFIRALTAERGMSFFNKQLARYSVKG